MHKSQETMNAIAQDVAGEVKSVAKSIGASLKSSGHDVPHGALLHAVAAALNKRNWHALKASANEQRGASKRISQSKNSPETLSFRSNSSAASVLEGYSDKELFWVKLAVLAGKPLKELPKTGAQAVAVCKVFAGTRISGIIDWGGWVAPAAIDLNTSSVDADELRPDTSNAIGQMGLSFPRAPITFEVAYTADKGWYLTAKGAAQFYAALDRLVPIEEVIEAAQHPRERVLEGPRVSAEFWTDDRAVEVNFDARLYLNNAADRELKSIIEVGYVGDTATDEVAQYTAQCGVNEELSAGFEYVAAKQRCNPHDDIGFECRVNAKEMLAWMAVHRPVALALILCERHSVKLIGPQESGASQGSGVWSWANASGRKSQQTFESREAAALGALRNLGLLQQELATL